MTGIKGSVRKDGNTAIVIQAVFEELRKAGSETEPIQLAWLLQRTKDTRTKDTRTNK